MKMQGRQFVRHPGNVDGCAASACKAYAAWRGSTPLPSAVICWLAVRPWSGSVTQPDLRPMSHSTNLGAGRGPVGSVRSAGAGADRPVMFSHRAMVAA